MEIGSNKWIDVIREGAKVFGVDVSFEQAKLFAVHAQELANWNRKINLTAIIDPFEIAVKHFIDSLAAAQMIPCNVTMLDIGSGGGFPGIPLKILKPNLSVTLIDASRKKVNFLKHICRTLKLDNIVVHQSRAEDIILNQEQIAGSKEDPYGFQQPYFKSLQRVSIKSFDIVISRALTSLREFFIMALPLLAGDGLIIAMRGKICESEAESLRLTFSSDSMAPFISGDDLSVRLKAYRLPFINAERSLISIKRQCRRKSEG